MINVIMHGCNGKMGRVITGLLKNDRELKIVAGIDPAFGFENDYPVYARPSDCPIKADVIIDFSHPSALPPLLSYAIHQSIPVVLCTTGFSAYELELIHKTAKEVPVLYSRNMSLGVNLLINLIKKASSILAGAGFDIEIIEKHHNQKIDAPSGTALAFADAINESLDHSYVYKYDRSSEREKRLKNEIGIHALRGGTIVGEHSVIFAGLDETIEFKHSANSKEIFAVGAINAARYLAGKPKGMYDMNDVINTMIM